MVSDIPGIYPEVWGFGIRRLYFGSIWLIIEQYGRVWDMEMEAGQVCSGVTDERWVVERVVDMEAYRLLVEVERLRAIESAVGRLLSTDLEESFLALDELEALVNE